MKKKQVQESTIDNDQSYLNRNHTFVFLIRLRLRCLYIIGFLFYPAIRCQQVSCTRDKLPQVISGMQYVMFDIVTQL